MKKKIILVLCCMLTMSICACGKTNIPDLSTETTETQAQEDEAVVKKLYEKGSYDKLKLEDHITLGDYSSLTNLEYTKASDSDIQNELTGYANSNSSVTQITDRAVTDTDDFVFSIAIGDQKYEYMQYQAGNDVFGDEFNKEVIGMKPGEEKTFKTTISQESGFSDYAGKETEVTVSITYIIGETIVPEVNDEFITTLTSGDYKTVDDFKTYIADYLNKNNKVNAIYDNFWTIMDASSYSDIDELVDAQYNYLKGYYENYAKENNVSYEELYTAYGYETNEAFDQQLKDDANGNVKQRLLIYALADAEKIDISDDDYTTYCKELVANYGYNSMTELINAEDIEGIRYYCVLQKVVEHFSDMAK